MRKPRSRRPVTRDLSRGNHGPKSAFADGLVGIGSGGEIPRRGGNASPVLPREAGTVREGCAPGGPGTRRACADADESRRCLARRGPGAVGNSRIVAYRARSPVWRLGAKHAQALQLRFSRAG